MQIHIEFISENHFQSITPMKYTFFLFVFITHFSFAQTSSVNKVIDKFEYQNDTLLTVYNWVTDNIRYDVDKLNKKKGKKRSTRKKTKKKKNRKRSSKAKKPSPPKSQSEINEERFKKLMKSKKGNCADYTFIFDEIVKELGYTSHVVSGVTKGKDGKVRTSSSHAWNAVLVEGKWKLYDPTWGAGTVKDNKKFVKKYFAKWYEADPEFMKETHFPFDPIWQLSEFPISFEEFEQDEIVGSLEENFDYKSLINLYFEQEDREKIEKELERCKLYGEEVGTVLRHQEYLQKRIEYLDRKEDSNSFQLTVAKCRELSAQFRLYNTSKRQNYQVEPWTLEYSKKTLFEMKEQLEVALSSLNKMTDSNTKSKSFFKDYLAQTERLLTNVDEELLYLDQK